MTFRSGEDRHQALRNWACGDHHAEAAVELLIAHGFWPQRLDDAGLMYVTHGRIRPGRRYGELARPDLLAALKDLHEDGGRLRASGVDHRILAFAASLAFGYEVRLAWALDLLDAERSSAVLAVFA